MRKIFAWISTIIGFGDEIVGRVVYWFAFIGLVSAPMSLVAAHITAISQYGWGVVVFAGIGISCAISLVASCALMAWRYFTPLPEQSAASTLEATLDQAKAQIEALAKEIENLNCAATAIKAQASTDAA
jgi:hypothetical protein